MPERIFTDDQLRRLGAVLDLSRDRFAEIYDPLASEKNGDSLKLVQVFADKGQTPFFAALDQARQGGWLSELIERLLHAGAIPDNAEPRIRVDLQGIVAPNLGFQDPEQLHTGVFIARRRVCRIRVRLEDADVYGTAFLVGPQTILTSWHVISELLDANGKEKENSHSLLEVTFDKVSGISGGEVVAVIKDWLVLCSPTHSAESPPASIVDFSDNVPEGFDQKLDYALLRLASPLGRQRGYYKLDRHRKPCVKPPRTQVTLFQHPAGGVMQVAHGSGSGLWPPGIETRMQHSANSMAGSSGGLILDADWQPVALHQCGYKSPDGKTIINGAIPTACIVAAAANDADAFSAVIGLDPIWRIPVLGEPILGRDEFQRLVQQAAFDQKRIISVYGDRNTGKTFCIRILAAMLGKAEHFIIELSPAERSVVPELFAAALLAKAGANALGLPSSNDAETAQDAWVRDVLYPTLIERLKAVASQTKIWLVLDDLDANGLANTATRQLLETIYREIASNPFLRVVLVGLHGVVPAAPHAFVSYYETVSLTESDIDTYIQRRNIELSQERPAQYSRDLARVTMYAARQYTLPNVPAVATAVKMMLEPVLEGR